MTSTKRITDFSISWQADHEQYWQGHGTAFSEYTHCATGCGSTLREAFEDALEDLCQQDSTFADLIGDMNKTTDTLEAEMLADLTSQVKEPEMLDLDIVQAECPEQGEHSVNCPVHGSDNDSDCEACGVKDNDPDCSVCAGEWHFYVSIDVKVEESEASQ